MLTEINSIIYSKKYSGLINDEVEINEIQIEENNVDLISFLRVGDKKIYPFWIEIEKIPSHNSETSM